jgi:hypothetical protein
MELVSSCETYHRITRPREKIEWRISLADAVARLLKGWGLSWNPEDLPLRDRESTAITPHQRQTTAR